MVHYLQNLINEERMKSQHQQDVRQKRKLEKGKEKSERDKDLKAHQQDYIDKISLFKD